MFQSMDWAHFKLCFVSLIVVLIVPIFTCNQINPHGINNDIQLMEPSYNISALGLKDKGTINGRHGSTVRTRDLVKRAALQISLRNNHAHANNPVKRDTVDAKVSDNNSTFDNSSDISNEFKLVSTGFSVGLNDSVKGTEELNNNQAFGINFDQFLDEISDVVIIIEPKIESNKSISLVGKVILKSNNQTFPLDVIEVEKDSLENIFGDLTERLMKKREDDYFNETNSINNQSENNIGIQINDQPSTLRETNCNCSCPKSSFDETLTTKLIPTQVITPTPAPENFFSTSVVPDVTESPHSTTTLAPTTTIKPISTTIKPISTTTNQPSTTIVLLSGTLAPEVHKHNIIDEKISEDAIPKKPKPIPQTPWIPDGAKPQYRGSNNPYLENEIETRDHRNNQMNSQNSNSINAPVARGVNDLSQPDYLKQFINRRDQNVPSHIQQNQPNRPRETNPDYTRHNVQNEAVNRKVPNRHEQNLPFAVEEIVHRRLSPQVKRDFISKVVDRYIANMYHKPQELYKETFRRQSSQSKSSQFQRKLL